MIWDFSDADQSYLQFKVCVDNLWYANYFFQSVIDPDSEFDDALIVDTLENVATIMIKGNQGPMIFTGNTFRDNIGTTGGAIHIEYPEFRHSGKPYIVMKDNRFLSNMAYFAGNAFHIQMQARYYMGYLDDD